MSQTHAPDAPVFGEAVEHLTRPLNHFLIHHQQAVLVAGAKRMFVNEVGVKAPQVLSILGDLGIGGLVLAGSWSPAATAALLLALRVTTGSSPLGRMRAAAHAASQIPPPAHLAVYDPQEMQGLINPPLEDPGPEGERTILLYIRLLALAELSHKRVFDGGSPDDLGGHVRLAIRLAVEGLGRPVCAWRMVNLALLPPLPMSSHIVNVTVLALAMGQELGLERHELADLGYAAFFHDLGRVGIGRRPTPDGQQEDPTVREAHIVDGVRYALRGRSSRSDALARLVVCQEHHAQMDGFPPLGAAPHPYSRIVAVADVFDKLEHGTPWAGPISPFEVLQKLEQEPARHDPVVVELLRRVLGPFPRGCFLRLQTGAVVASVGGGARYGDSLLARRLLNPDASLDDERRLERVECSAVDEEVDPEWLGLSAWKMVLGEEPEGPDEDDQLDFLGGQGDQVLSEEARLALKPTLEALQRALRFFRLYAPDHPLAAKAVARLGEGLQQHLATQSQLKLDIRRDGVYLGDAMILADGAHATDLPTLLRPAGIRGLTLQQGMDPAELHRVVGALASEGGGDTIQVELWRRDLPHLTVHLHDQLSTQDLERAWNPTLAAVVARIQDLRTKLRVGDPDGVRFVAALDRVPGSAADPKLQELLAEVRSADLTERASLVVAWALTQQRPPEQEHVARFKIGAVRAVLLRGDLDAACARIGALDRAAVEYLVDADTMSLIDRSVHGPGAGPDAVGAGLELLAQLGAGAVPVVCDYYASLTGKEEQRRFFATFLIEHVKTAADTIAALSLHGDAQISREAVILLAQGQPGSRGWELIEQYAADRSNPQRAAVAKEIIDNRSGGGERKVCLDAIDKGPDVAVRVRAARLLKKIGDPADFNRLSEIVLRREFNNRDSEEVNAVLDTLVHLGGSRAARVLEELSTRTGGFMRKSSTRKLSRSATSFLQKLKAGKRQAHETQRMQKGACQRCRFMNVPGAQSCLQCGMPLFEERPRDKERTRVAATARHRPLPKEMAETAQWSGEAIKKAVSNVAFSEAEARKALAWICYPDLDPVPIGLEPTATIGRAKTSDLVLIHDSVSRTHVIIRISGEKMTLEDRSSYGTWVNGERVMSHQLKTGDVITCGPFDLKVEDSKTVQSREVETKPLRTFSSSEAIGGRLERVSLAEVLQQIEFNQKTGTLEVFTDDGGSGTLVVYEGKPMYAEFGELKDDPAVIRMLTLERGNFSFRAKIEAGEMTMSSNITHLLMDASRRIDEAGL